MKTLVKLFDSTHTSIGIFDSGYGGLTILKAIRQTLPQYDYIYIGDNARSPYGGRSFETIRNYTLESVTTLFAMCCPLVILACNTASAKALRSIQQQYLPRCETPEKRVLGVIRPSVEIIPNLSKNGHVGIFATEGTVRSLSYVMEIQKFWPNIIVTQEACPLWVPIVENGEIDSEGSLFFIKKHCENLLKRDPLIDTIILGCTHYPLLLPKIQQFLPSYIKIISQGEIIANSLKDYLTRHEKIKNKLTTNGTCLFFTTETTELFNNRATLFLNEKITSQHLEKLSNFIPENFSFNNL